MPTSWRKTVLTGVVLLGMALSPGCDSFGPEEPEGPGALFVDLQSPNGNEGAAVLLIQEGWGLGGITSASGWVFEEEVGDDLRVVVMLPTPGPIQFQIQSNDVSRLPAVSLVQVAGPENELRESLAGYEVEIFQMAERRAR